VKAHEIYQALDQELLHQMLNWFRDNERSVYQNALATIAGKRNLRPVFIQRKPLPDQYGWFEKMLKLKSCDTVGEHLLQAWFLAGHQDLLAAFCDAMDIPHDGKGSVEGELPADLDTEKLDAAIDTLIESRDPRLITLYLRVFNLQTAEGWPAITAKLESDERLKLGEAAEPEATEPEATESEATEPEAAESEATESEATESEATESEAAEPEAAEPEAAESEAAESGTAESSDKTAE